MCGFCKVWVCVCVGFVKCGCVYVWVFKVWVCVCVCVEFFCKFIFLFTTLCSLYCFLFFYV
jgi:hypothetical protein